LIESPPEPVVVTSTPKSDDTEDTVSTTETNTTSSSTAGEDDEDEVESPSDTEEEKESQPEEEAQPAEILEPPQEPESVARQALRRVFQDMEKSTGPVAPRYFCQMIGIPVLEQQDSQEFWKLLLPALKLPALTDLYQGSFEDFIRATDGSNREKRREEAFLDLSLDLSR